MDRRARIGVVLAGGRSSRMGRDKARLVDAGAVVIPGAPIRSWLERTLDILAPHVDETWVVGRRVTADDCPNSSYLPPSREDRRRGVGPLAGLETALEIGGEREVLVAACDLPSLDANAVATLMRAAEADLPSESTPEAGSAAGDRYVAFAFRDPRSSGAEPRFAGLLLLLRPRALVPLRELLDGDERRVGEFLRQMDTCWVTAEPAILAALRNANRPEDLCPDQNGSRNDGAAGRTGGRST